jgi:hypothetical protein
MFCGNRLFDGEGTEVARRDIEDVSDVQSVALTDEGIAAHMQTPCGMETLPKKRVVARKGDSAPPLALVRGGVRAQKYVHHK